MESLKSRLEKASKVYQIMGNDGVLGTEPGSGILKSAFFLEILLFPSRAQRYFHEERNNQIETGAWERVADLKRAIGLKDPKP